MTGKNIFTTYMTAKAYSFKILAFGLKYIDNFNLWKNMLDGQIIQIN